MCNIDQTNRVTVNTTDGRNQKTIQLTLGLGGPVLKCLLGLRLESLRVMTAMGNTPRTGKENAHNKASNKPHYT